MKLGDVVLISVPPGLLDGLPEEDQEAILEIVGQPIEYRGYCDAWARLELNFIDKAGDRHTIWVEECFIQHIDEKPVEEPVEPRPVEKPDDEKVSD